MKIQDFGTLQMWSTNDQHYGAKKIVPVTTNKPGLEPVSAVEKLNQNTQAASVSAAGEKHSFQDFLLEAMNEMNAQQLDVQKVEQQLMTDPESINPEEAAISMAKARMSLNLAQNVIDRLVTGWNEITTTR